MARAKKTDRAEARRRYRAEMGLTSEVDGEDVAQDATASPAKASAPRSGDQRNANPTGRMSMGAAFRQSIHPINLRDDLRSIPFLVLHTRAIWAPSLITIVSAVAFIVTHGSDFLTQFGFAYFVQTPAIGSVFLAGFLAPRASWLAGLIVGLVAAIAYSGVIAVVALGTSEAAAAQQAMASAFILSPVMGALFAAAAAWYRRFLQLSNPNRGRRAAAPAKKGNDGRTRNSNAAKASSARR